MSVLRISGLRAAVAGKEVLHGIDLEVRSGEVHAVMGPNGAGKSTLGYVLMGRPGYEVLGGSATIDGLDLLTLPTYERARAGLFLAPQDPTAVPGVPLTVVLAAALAAAGPDGQGVLSVAEAAAELAAAERTGSLPAGPLAAGAGPLGTGAAPGAGDGGGAGGGGDGGGGGGGAGGGDGGGGGAGGGSSGDGRALQRRLADEARRIGLDVALLERGLNVDASGGERKRLETLQLAMLRPRFAVLDELDSGLDVDALRAVALRVEAATRHRGLGEAGAAPPDDDQRLGVLAITHYRRLLDQLRPDRVHVLVDGRIVASGGPELAAELERTGYAEHHRPGEDVPG
jgi:Fe-S cluster assembly ATP-binding protein